MLPSKFSTGDSVDVHLQKFHGTYEGLMDPVITSMRREIAAIISRLHRIDFGKAVDPLSMGGGSSFYMKELVEKLTFYKSEILSRYNVGDDSHSWCVEMLMLESDVISCTEIWLLRQACGDCEVCDSNICSPHLDRKTAWREREAAADKRYDGARVCFECVHD
jgi:hypothetical protein